MKRLSLLTTIACLISANVFAQAPEPGGPTPDNNIVNWGQLRTDDTVTWMNPAAWARADLEPPGIDPPGSFANGIDFDPFNSSNVGFDFDDNWFKRSWDTNIPNEYFNGASIPWEVSAEGEGLPIGFGAIDATASPNGVLFQQTGVEGLAVDMITPDSGERYASYMRMPLNIPSNAGSGPFIFEALVDDGATIYLDDEKWIDINCCNAADGNLVEGNPFYGDVAFNATATETEFKQVVLDSLPRGNNKLMAVALRSNSTTSSDQGFDFRIFTPGNYRPWGVNESGNWTNSDNWEIDSAGSNEFAIFGGGRTNVTGSKTIFTDSTISVDGVQFEGNATFAIAGTGAVNLNGRSGSDAALNVMDGSHEFQVVVGLNKDTVAHIEDGASIDFNNELNLNGNLLQKIGGGDLIIGNDETEGAGSIEVFAGALGGGGTIGGNVSVQGGAIAPGGVVDALGSAAVLTINGNASVDSGGITLNVFGNGEADAVSGGGSGTLTMAAGSALTINVAPSYTPADGDKVEIFPGWSSINGTVNAPAGWAFDSATGELTFGENGGGDDCDLNGDGNCDIADLDQVVDSGGDISAWLAEAGNKNGLGGSYLNGDANLDGTVDAQDLNAVGQNWLGENKTWSTGDFNGDDKTDAQDLNAVGQNWLQVAPAAAATAAVPEPSSISLLVFAVLGFGLRRRS